MSPEAKAASLQWIARYAGEELTAANLRAQDAWTEQFYGDGTIAPPYQRGRIPKGAKLWGWYKDALIRARRHTRS